MPLLLWYHCQLGTWYVVATRTTLLRTLLTSLTYQTISRNLTHSRNQSTINNQTIKQSNNILALVIGANGNYFKYIFDPAEGGEAKLEGTAQYRKQDDSDA
jgi:hypothetical protein